MHLAQHHTLCILLPFLFLKKFYSSIVNNLFSGISQNPTKTQKREKWDFKKSLHGQQRIHVINHHLDCIDTIILTTEITKMKTSSNLDMAWNVFKYCTVLRALGSVMILVVLGIIGVSYYAVVVAKYGPALFLGGLDSITALFVLFLFHSLVSKTLYVFVFENLFICITFRLLFSTYVGRDSSDHLCYLVQLVCIACFLFIFKSLWFCD